MQLETDVHKEMFGAVVAHNKFLVAPAVLIVAGLGGVVWIEDASVERFVTYM